MRKIDDKKLLEMIKQGKLQKEIAEHFKVSPVAVCKRLKRLLPPPKSLENLTAKEKKFAIEVSRGKTATQATLASYEVSSMNSAKVMGSQLMNKPEIKMAIEELMEWHGLTRSYRIKKLKEHTENRDPGVSLKALDMSFKLANEYPQNRQEATIHIDIGARLDEARKRIEARNILEAEKVDEAEK
ncbi:MAG: terminase small subunit [Deltaproteobacteria bacterium]|nr:terminase small subunit [Deltaproteobacteria bacterium]